MKKTKEIWRVTRALLLLGVILWILIAIMHYTQKKKDYSQYNLEKYIEFHREVEKNK
ncbi:MAG TPA: hypothetical protein PKZ69_00900 [Candidatus Cloacimonadota bacterium]|nr:hypothetical protein [Candidatus Cloacimonadota bacterium]HPK40153.1 hypothetical protein [Candidatus Cloacimonadota bacterium]